MTQRQVVITDDARQDLASIYDYIADNNSVAQAEAVMDRLLDVAKSLAANAERGSHPRELLAYGFHECRQIMTKPWQVIYGIEPSRVIVYVIVDGRRDLRTLLTQRLLGA